MFSGIAKIVLTNLSRYGIIERKEGYTVPFRVHYIDDREVAELFEEDCSRHEATRNRLIGHPYFSFITGDNDGAEEDEAFCSTFLHSLED